MTEVLKTNSAKQNLLWLEKAKSLKKENDEKHKVATQISLKQQESDKQARSACFDTLLSNLQEFNGSITVRSKPLHVNGDKSLYTIKVVEQGSGSGFIPLLELSVQINGDHYPVIQHTLKNGLLSSPKFDTLEVFMEEFILWVVNEVKFT